MPSLFDKRLLIFSGKGGAGKTSVAAAAAVAAARRGKRVLVVEIGDEERLPSIFGSRKKAGYAGGPVLAMPGAPPIWSMCLTAREALREFAVRSVKFEVFYETIFENPVTRLFTAAAPGLDELTIMGKLEFLVRDSVAPARNGPFDLVILDAPSTGQGLALFKVPLMAMSMARMGPLHTKAERMWQLVADSARTAFNIVTLPEEMPVNEAIDLHRAATEMGLPPGKLIVNGVYPDFFPGDEAALSRARVRGAVPADLPGRLARAAVDAAASFVTRRQAHLALIAKLDAAVPLERITLPFLFTPRIGAGELATFADSLDGF